MRSTPRLGEKRRRRKRRKRKRRRRGVTARPNSEKSAVFNDGDHGDSETTTQRGRRREAD